MRRPTLLDLLLWSNLLMAASAAGWVIVAQRQLALPRDGVPIAIAALLAVAFYTRDRLDEQEQAGDAATMPVRTAWMQRHRRALRGWASGCALLALGLIAMRPAMIPPLLAGLAFALTYTVRWIPWRGRRLAWKQLPAMKMPYVAALWTLLTIIAPATVAGQGRSAMTWLLAAAVCLLIMTQVLLNDLRDIEGDRAAGTASLPVLVGGRAARLLGLGAALIAAALALRLAAPALLVTAAYSAALLVAYQRSRDAWWRPAIEVQGVVAALVAVVEIVQ